MKSGEKAPIAKVALDNFEQAAFVFRKFAQS